MTVESSPPVWVFLYILPKLLLKWSFFYVIDYQPFTTFLQNNHKIAWKIQTFYLHLLCNKSLNT